MDVWGAGRDGKEGVGGVHVYEHREVGERESGVYASTGRTWGTFMCMSE